MDKKVFGCILMILGTTFGAGMLALPVVTANESFTFSMALLVFSWLMMTIGAYALLEVNLALPSNTNMISMAEKTLGTLGKLITWIVYLLLLYSLICAYLSGISDIIQSLLMKFNLTLSRSFTTIIGLLIFGLIVYKGIGTVDKVNQLLMSIKLIAYFILVSLISTHITINPIFEGDYQFHHNAFMVMLTAFGYAIILPSLRHYLDSNKNMLKKVVLIGSLLPLLFYTVWIFVIQGLIPKTGSDGLVSMITSSHTNSMLMYSVSTKLNVSWLSTIINLFISICAATAFLGVSICLTDFIADGLKLSKQGHSRFWIYTISFLPPLLIVLVFPGIFIKALSYAGILCLILLIILPLTMLYVSRYKLGMKDHILLPYGKGLVISTLLVGFLLLSVNLYHL